MSVEELQKQILELRAENEELKRKVDEFEIPRVGKFRPFEIESQALRTRIEELERENENLKTEKNVDASKRIFKAQTPDPDMVKTIAEKNKLEIQVRDLTHELNDLRARSSALERLSENETKSNTGNIQNEREIRKSLEVTNAKLVKEIETANVAFKKN